MTDLGPGHIQTLTELATLVKARFIVIGATAFDIRIGLDWRSTHDLDIVVETDVVELAGLLDLPGWRRVTDHCWRSSAGVLVDALPVPTDAASTSISWPSGQEMSIVGLRAALRAAPALEVVPGLEVHVPLIPVLLMLKIAAYVERPLERARDLHDLAVCLTRYVGDVDERRFTTAMADLDLHVDAQCPYFLGQDLRDHLGEAERSVLERFFALTRDPEGRHFTFEKIASHLAPRSVQLVREMLDAYERGAQA